MYKFALVAFVSFIASIPILPLICANKTVGLRFVTETAPRIQRAGGPPLELEPGPTQFRRIAWMDNPPEGLSLQTTNAACG
ncbi:MAG: hypothetical protein ABR956_00840 [Terracidiphilus sp.]